MNEIKLLLSLALASVPLSPAHAEHGYAIPDTTVVDLPTAANGIDYQLYIHVPPKCRAAGTTCSTVYMLDAEYSFGLSAQIITHLADRDRIPPLISVAIGYRDKSQYRLNRSRDYTPYFHRTGGYGEETQRLSGGGPAFLEFLRNQAIPYVEANFPASPQERTLVGHSYGGLFATYAWIEQPDLFSNYIIVSPSLWYAEGRPLEDIEKACQSQPFAAERDLFLAVGDYEEQPENGRAMVSDLRRMEGLLQSCAARKVSSYLRVYEDETHASIFPAAFSTGIRKHFQ